MHFVLDANTVISEQFGASAHFKALLAASSAVGYTVYLPVIALEEIAAKYERELSKNVQEAGKGLSTLSRLLGRRLHSPIEGFDSRNEKASFQKNLLSQLRVAQGTVLDYPSTPHETLVKRATSRKRPFAENGSGYRDALIWETVLELAAQVDETIVLVSNDKDFRDTTVNLHSELVQDLERLGLPKHSVILATELSGLVDEHVRPNLGTVPWEKPLQILAGRGLNLADSIGMLVQDACAGQEWEPSELGIPSEYESPTLDMVEDVSDLTVVDLRDLPPNQVLLKIEASIFADFGVFVYKMDWYGTDDPRLYLDEIDWNDHYVRAGISVPLRCELDLVVDTSDNEHHEVRDLSVELRTMD